VRLDGVLDLTYAEDGGNIASTRLEADGPVTARVVTPTFSDTVTLLSGFAVQGIYDASVPPPAGGANPGRTRSIVSGRLDSAAAGGIVLVATESALVQYTDDANPRSGRISVTGSTGTLRVVVLNSDSVRIEVDADDNGTFENAVVADWDWLL